MVYLAFIFALALACIAGVEFVSLMALETRNRQLRGRVDQLERENARISEGLRSVKAMIEGQPQEEEEEEEAWPELIDGDSIR